jgi:uncharacterized protein with beta-barrel porin domain
MASMGDFMKKISFVSALGLAIVTWSPASFAQQQTAVGPGVTPLNATGVTNGVAMSASGGTGTLGVGVVGGPEMDIFTNNSAGGIVTNSLLRAVTTDASSTANIVFNSSSNVYGAIGVTQPGGPFFLDVTGGNNGTVVNLDGNLFATITTVNGTGTLNFNSGSTNITATNFAADGTINIAPNGTVIGALTTNTADTGTLVLGGGSVLNGAVGGANGLKAINVVGGSNTAGVTSTISGAVDAYSFNLGTNTLNVGGALTIASSTVSGVVNTTLASPTVYGNIRPLGATNLGPTLHVDVAVPATAFFPVGTQFNIVQTQTGTVQSGTNGTVVVVVGDPTNPLYTFSAVPAAGTVAGEVSIVTTGIPLLVPVAPPAGAPPVVITPPTLPPIVVAPLPVAVALPPVTPVAAPVVPVVLAAAATLPPSSDLVGTVLPAIDAISNPVTVVNAIAQLAPSLADLAAGRVTFEEAREFQNALSSRLDDSLCGGGGQSADQRKPDDQRRRDEQSSSCPENGPYTGLWAKGFGYFGNQGAQGAYLGYDSKIAGVMLGYDMPLTDDTRAGVAIGYARSTIDGKIFTANTGFDTYQAMIYIDHESQTWFADGDVSYGRSDYSETREIVFPGIDRTADGRYGGNDVTGYLTTGYHFFTDGFAITPLASLQATFVNLNAYTETGASELNLQVASQNYDFLESGLGVTVARYFGISDAIDGVPEGHFKWLHELVNPTLENTTAFVAAGSLPFTTPGLRSAPDTLDAGAGLTLLSCASCGARTWSVEAVYDYYWRNDDYSAQQVTLEISDRF